MVKVPTKNTFIEYLNKHYVSAGEKGHTNLRIADRKLNISGGKYNISNPEEFRAKYYDHVWCKKQHEYLTEKQLIENGPILIDLDLRYDTSVDSRLHTDDHILDAIGAYADTCLELVDITSKFDIYVMHKPSVKMEEKKTKDGIHIIIGIQMHKALQVILREKILEKIKDLWDDIPIINTWDDVIDEGITKGTTDWQMYGSRKPGNEAYELTHHYTFTKYDKGWSPKKHNIEDFDYKTNLYKLSARNSEWQKYDIRDEYNELFKIECEKLSSKKKNSNKNKTQLTVIPDYKDYLALLRLNKAPNINSDILDTMIEDWHNEIDICQYKIIEAHSYTMCLPQSYYGPGSFSKWIRVGWALANTDRNMFLTWLRFSSREVCRDSLKGSNGFDWSNVRELFNMWQDFDYDNPEGLTSRSIMYWAKVDAEEEYKNVWRDTTKYFMEESIKSSTDFDLANVLYNTYKDRFVCVNIAKNLWYEYINNRWYESDSGTNLRLLISKDLHQLYLKELVSTNNSYNNQDSSSEEGNNKNTRSAILATICTRLKTTNHKNNIMREARELFYNKDFIEKLDTNPYLLCFNNYVVDFEKGIHRKGQPDDYLSKCTKIDYSPFDEKKHGEVFADIDTFINQLFPNLELRQYMWEHLSSCLIGKNDQQTFNKYLGGGRNGKSKLVDLMSKCLGDYKGTVPITLITQKRNSIGSTSSEIVQLMGVRYAVMQEPSKDEGKVNEGILKEITGGDPIQGRALFKDTITFTPQFNLVVCTNTDLEINSNDDGTWRRIRVCEFESKFLENPNTVDNPKNNSLFPLRSNPYQYPVDRKIDEKFNTWAPVLMSYLVKLAYKYKGAVRDCNKVTDRTLKYRESQDYLARFIKEKIIEKEGGKIKKQELWETFVPWYNQNYKNKTPKKDEVENHLNQYCGGYDKDSKKGWGWHNFVIVYDEDEMPEISDTFNDNLEE
tara:strand:- start:405 stop:3257 length:2853 start_codon:yes stop_codon:yes gene_type:complete